MHEARFGCAVVAHQGRIYVGGGFGQDKAILCTVESYDPDTDKVYAYGVNICQEIKVSSLQWTKLPHMKKICGFVGGVLVDRPVHFDNDQDI